MQSHRNEFSERSYLWNDLPMMMMMLLDWDLCPYRVDQSFQALRTVNQLQSPCVKKRGSLRQGKHPVHISDNRCEWKLRTYSEFLALEIESMTLLGHCLLLSFGRTNSSSRDTALSA